MMLALLLVFAAPSADLEVPAQDRLGKVCYANGEEKAITPEAVEWLAKMVHGETRGGPSQLDAEWMLWSLVQRSAIWQFRTWEWRKLVQAYSQPVNPAWTRTGKYCKKYWAEGYTGAIADACAKKRVDLRDKYIAMSWADTHATAKKAAIDLATGKLANPSPGAVGWFDPGTWRSREKNGSNAKSNMVLVDTVDGNSYFAMSKGPDTRKWTAATVSVVGPGETCPSAGQSPTPKDTPAPSTKKKPALGSCESSYGYHRAGRIELVFPDAEGNAAILSIGKAGWADGVCDDATGMVYVGDDDEAFVTDGAGKKVRFRVTTVDEHWITAKVIEGRVKPSVLELNRRVVLRKKK
jgi:hypothetical protein